jgi:alpha-D-ribose 1-methylphosphonate 5-triphosphate diphosphatase
MTLTLTNAAILLPDRVVHGTLHAELGVIEAIAPGRSHPGGLDCDGDYVMPGVVDLHTDNLERQVQPRQNARWPSRAALLAHDAQCAAAGITTVFDALCAGHAGLDDDRPRTCAEGMADLDALAPTGLLKAEHFLHLRCELPAQTMLEQLETYANHPLLRLVSLMDHTPGVGQFGDLTRYRAMLRQDGLTPDAIEARIALLLEQRARLREPNRRAVLSLMAERGVPIAGHDDSSAEEIAENLADGIGISEFPVSVAAASAARAGGMGVIAGAPNLVRGGSHSGNVAVADLLREGLVDALASDYVPGSLVHAAFLAAEIGGIGLPAAVGMVTSAPARMAGLNDRGTLALGMRADLVRVRVHDGVPVVRQVWRAGERVI